MLLSVAAPQAIFLNGMHLVFHLHSLLFNCGTSVESMQLRTALIHSNPSVHGRGFHSLRIHRRGHLVYRGRVLVCTRRGLLKLERAVQCSTLRFRASLQPRISSSSRSHCGTRSLAAGASGAFWENIPVQPSELRCVPQLLSALQLPSLSRSRV